MPATSIDTYFACTIIVAVALIATAFLGSTMQTRIAATQDINKDSYLNAIADHIITSPGAPLNWGAGSGVPEDFGLALSSSTTPYELDLDKICRLNSQNNYSLTYPQIVGAAKLNNIAVGITVTPLLTINVAQSDAHALGNEVAYTFVVSTAVSSQPTNVDLRCYIIADGYLSSVTNDTAANGVGYVSFQLPQTQAENALLVVFARAPFDDRVTSYAIYDFASSSQESTPSNTAAELSPLNYTLTITPSSSDVTIGKAYVFSYTSQKNLTFTSDFECQIPKTIDKSPTVIVACGLNSSTYLQEWTSYPQIPFTAGSSFNGSEKNVFTYVVTIKENLYKLDISFGDVPH
jgi:hypothetical protein